MTTIIRRRPPRWPAAANAVRLRVMENEERQAQIAREMLQDPDVKRSDRLRALAYESMALAEQNRRQLGEARPE